MSSLICETHLVVDAVHDVEAQILLFVIVIIILSIASFILLVIIAIIQIRIDNLFARVDPMLIRHHTSCSARDDIPACVPLHATPRCDSTRDHTPRLSRRRWLIVILVIVIVLIPILRRDGCIVVFSTNTWYADAGHAGNRHAWCGDTGGVGPDRESRFDVFVFVVFVIIVVVGALEKE
jgi:nitrate reductase NapE component